MPTVRARKCAATPIARGQIVYDRGLTDKTELTIETRAGIKTLWLNVVGGTVETVRVCMGSPEFRPEKIPVAAAGETFLEQPIDVLGRDMDRLVGQYRQPALCHLRGRCHGAGFPAHWPRV